MDASLDCLGAILCCLFGIPLVYGFVQGFVGFFREAEASSEDLRRGVKSWIWFACERNGVEELAQVDHRRVEP